MFTVLSGDSPPEKVGFFAGLVVLVNQQGRVQVVTVDGKLPVRGVRSFRSRNEAAILLRDLTGLDGRVTPLGSGVCDVRFALLHEDEAVYAVYGVLLGGRTSLLDPAAAWTPFDKLPDDAAVLVADVGRRL